MTIMFRNDYPSPNRRRRPHGVTIDTLLVHYSAGHGNSRSLGRVFAARSRKASSHLGIGRDGDDDVQQYVDFDDVAWHAGDGSLMIPGVPSHYRVNERSIGIELCNRGWAPSKFGRARADARHRNPRSMSTTWEVYPDEQIATLVRVVDTLLGMFPTLEFVTGHEDVTNYLTTGHDKDNDGVIEPLEYGGSKLDPGPLFPWSIFGGKLKRVRFNFDTGTFEVVT